MERPGSPTLGPPACARSGATQRHDLICRRGLRKHCFTLRQRQYVAQEDLNDGRSKGANVGDRSRNVQNVIRHVLALTSDMLSESGSSSPICKIISPHKQACEDMARQSDEAPEMDGCRHCLSGVVQDRITVGR